MPADRSTDEGENQGGDDKPGPKHRRSRKGCVRCRYLKKKCDEGTPCGRCTLSSSECQYYRAPPFPWQPPTGRGPAPTSIVTNAVNGAVVYGGGVQPQQAQAFGWEGTPAMNVAVENPGWDARLMGGGAGVAPSQAVQQQPQGQQGGQGQQQVENGWPNHQPRASTSASNTLTTTVAPSPPSHSALRGGEDGSELFMDLSWQSSIGALYQIGAPKLKNNNDFDFLTGNYLDSPGPWAASSPQPPPPPVRSTERFTEIEVIRPVAAAAQLQPRLKQLTPPNFPPFPPVPLERPPEVPKIPYLFAGSLGPRALPDGSDSELISYFQNVTTGTIVAIDDAANNPYRTTFLSLWRPSRSPTANTPDPNSALLHALFCVSAVHSGNLARARMQRGEIDLEDFPDFGSRARLHRGQALRVLREAAKARAGEEEQNEDEGDGSGSGSSGSDVGEKEKREEMEVTSAAVMLLVVQSVLEGDSKLVPLLLQNAESYIRRLSLERLTPSTINLMMLHSVYTLINNIVRGKTLVGVRLLWAEIDESQAGLVKATMGIGRNMLEFWGRAHSLIVRQREINGLLNRHGGPPPGHDELRWEVAELQADLDTLEAELADDEGWFLNWIRPEEASRVRLGHHFFRAAVRVYILRAGFGTPARDERVQACVKSVIKLTRETPVGSEVGLSWPLLITGCEALGTDRDDILSFVKRCQWKGSAPPMRVEQVLMGSWNEGKTWSETLEAVGYPLIL